MVIESLGLYYHIECFRCFVCNIPLSSSLEGTDVRIRSNRLHCQNCFSDENGEKILLLYFISYDQHMRNFHSLTIFLGAWRANVRRRICLSSFLFIFLSPNSF
jgi:F-box protein 20